MEVNIKRIRSQAIATALEAFERAWEERRFVAALEALISVQRDVTNYIGDCAFQVYDS